MLRTSLIVDCPHILHERNPQWRWKVFKKVITQLRHPQTCKSNKVIFRLSYQSCLIDFENHRLTQYIVFSVQSFKISAVLFASAIQFFSQMLRLIWIDSNVFLKKVISTSFEELSHTLHCCL